MTYFSYFRFYVFCCCVHFCLFLYGFLPMLLKVFSVFGENLGGQGDRQTRGPGDPGTRGPKEKQVPKKYALLIPQQHARMGPAQSPSRSVRVVMLPLLSSLDEG